MSLLITPLLWATTCGSLTARLNAADVQVAHFLEANLRPWAAPLAAALFCPISAQHKARQLASPGVRDAPAQSGSASAAAVVSSAARRESAWRCLEELRPLHGAAESVLRASELPLLEQLPLTPARWGPAVIDSHVVDGALDLSYLEAAFCCNPMHAVHGVHALTLHGSSVASDDTQAELLEQRACTAVEALSRLRTIKLTQDFGTCASLPVLALLLAVTRLTQLAELELHWHQDNGNVPGPPICLPTSLTRLHLTSTVNDDGLCTFVCSLTSLSRLAHFTFSDDGEDDGEFVAEFAAALSHLTALTALQLDQIYVGGAVAEALAPALRRLSRLSALRLTECYLEEEGFAATLASPIALLTALTALDLTESGVGDAGAEALAPALGRLSQLADLRLAQNEIGPDGAAALAPALSHLAALTLLDLSENEIRPDGAEALAPALGRLSRLAALVLLCNRFRAAGAAALAPSIGLLTALTLLQLDDNELGAGGAVSLAPALGRLSRLEDLTLSYNDLGAAGAAALIALLTALTALDLSVNDVGADGAEALAPALSRLSRLADLHLCLLYTSPSPRD